MNNDISRVWRVSQAVRLNWAPLLLLLPVIAGAQSSSAGRTSDSCAALMHLNLTDAQGGPALISSARAVDVPGRVRRTDLYPSGYSDGTSHRSSNIRRYCDITGEQVRIETAASARLERQFLFQRVRRILWVERSRPVYPSIRSGRSIRGGGIL